MSLAPAAVEGHTQEDHHREESQMHQPPHDEKGAESTSTYTTTRAETATKTHTTAWT